MCLFAILLTIACSSGSGHGHFSGSCGRRRHSRFSALVRCIFRSDSYENKDQNPVLRDLTFTTNRGDFIAITIPPPTGGEIVPLDTGARNMISYVPQDNFGTIREAVLLLNEATSALDEPTETKVPDNLRQLYNRTVIIVTHRKAALDICNRIVEMENGRIREINE